MELVVRLAVGVALVAGLACGAACTQPPWAEALGLAFWHIPGYLRQIGAETQREKHLDEQFTRDTQLAQRHDRLLDELLAGRLALTAAADELTAQSGAGYVEQVAASLAIPGRTTDERACRLLIEWAGRRFLEDPDAARCVRARLERELESTPHPAAGRE